MFVERLYVGFMDQKTKFRGLGLSAVMLALTAHGHSMGEAEKQSAIAFWSSPGRYEVVPANPDSAPFQVRLTPEGSLWLWALNQKRGIGKNAQVPMPAVADQDDWDAWIATKIDFDRWQAQLSVRQLNAAKGFPGGALGPQPPAPGPMPESLRYLVGDAPLMANAAEPKTHRIKFSDGELYELTDNPSLDKAFPSYRFTEGIRHFGTPVRKLERDQIQNLFQQSGITTSEQKIFKAVSLLEGGFESVNTYDTGWVSVGFIQFACLPKGSGSLGAVLRRHKQTNCESFRNDFQKLGIDVADDGQLIALDLSSGDELKGPEAAKKIISDKRLIAVFHRAGLKSNPFKVAQLQIAKEWYYPAEDTVNVVINGKTQAVKVGEFIKSEAGLATMMDRKVNAGNLGNLATVASRVASDYKVRSTGELAKYEYEIVQQMRFRKQFLGDDSMGQPTSRSNSRSAKVTPKSVTRSKSKTKQ